MRGKRGEKKWDEVIRKEGSQKRKKGGNERSGRVTGHRRPSPKQLSGRSATRREEKQTSTWPVELTGERHGADARVTSDE